MRATERMTNEEFFGIPEPLEPDYDFDMNLWAGQIYLDRATEGAKRMLEELCGGVKE